MNLNLDINDMCCSNCFKNAVNTNITINDTTTTIELQGNYTLNVIQISNTQATILIQNGSYVIIRIIPFNTETSILIPSKCSHIVTLTITNS